MDDKQLDKFLEKIGKECFVTFYELFCDITLRNIDVALLIQEERGYTDKACASRTSKARTIIKAGRARDALDICSKSERLPCHIREKATRLVDGAPL